MAAADFVVAADHECDCLGVCDVFFSENAARKGMLVIGLQYRNGTLQEDDPVIEMLIDKVNGAAGDFDAVVEGLLLSVEARKCWQKRGMDVEYAVVKGGDELGR